ncbi:MAG: glycosyltransferase, partial [Bacteroides sp.]|nr:glycosyltransferase [Bacteroides sp.]
MKNNPLISVLIPVYNVEKYVERCILSVLNQTMQEGVEVIIVNDCTPDSSMDIIAKV